jgi:hypothetical protein
MEKIEKIGFIIWAIIFCAGGIFGGIIGAHGDNGFDLFAGIFLGLYGGYLLGGPIKWLIELLYSDFIFHQKWGA